MNQTNKYYEHSGSIGLIGPIYMLIFGAVGALIFGVIYGYAIFYIPFIYLNFFITLGFGGGVGFLIGIGGKLGKVRNSNALLFFGFIFGLFAEYVGWSSWILAASEQETLLVTPSSILSVIQTVSENGAWSIFGWTPTDTALYIIWVIEAVIIIGTSTMMAWGVISSTPFCEHCNKWIEEKDSILPLTPIDNPNVLVAQLEQGDYSSLTTLRKDDTEPTSYTQIDLLSCPSCQQSNFLTIKSITISKDSDGKEQKDEGTVIENLIITAEGYRMIKEQW